MTLDIIEKTLIKIIVNLNNVKTMDLSSVKILKSSSILRF